MTDQIHAERRDPEQPAGAFDLHEAGRKLLETAAKLSAGRASRALTPGRGVALSQTLLALVQGRRLDEHRAPDFATIQVLEGVVTITAEGDRLELEAGQWAVIPDRDHDLYADHDAVVLLTVVMPGGDAN